MYYVYVLFSLKDQKLYIGKSSNLEKRYKQHQKGKVYSTKNRLPVKLIYYEAYLLSKEATRREKYLKGGNGRATLKIQIKDTLEYFNYLHR